MQQHYFHRVRRLTRSQFYINNATCGQAALALTEGATGCTNNPAFAWKILSNPEQAAYVTPLLDEAIDRAGDDNQAQRILQGMLVKDVSELFMPLYRESRGRYGYVSIQGDPLDEDDAQPIIDQGRTNRELNPNVCIKIPATRAGLSAMRTLLKEDTPVNATEIMSVAQGMDVCRIYREVTEEIGRRPPLFLSFISGILNEYLRKAYAAGALDVERDMLWQAGAATCRKLHRMIEEGGHPITMVSGGVRENADFTDFVGGNIAITVNWLGRGSATSLLEADPAVVPMMDLPTPPSVIDELRARVPDFARAYDRHGLTADEYADFGPVVLFRDGFVAAWNQALDFIAARRQTLDKCPL